MLSQYLMLMDDDGERQKLLRLLEAYEKKLYWIAMSYLHDSARAEDAEQQSFLQILQNFATISSIPWDETEPYVVIVVKNVCKDILRREKKYVALPEDWTPSPSTGEETMGELERLVAIVRSMPEKDRTILEMKFVLEYSNKEIAAYLGMKESTVSTRIERGRKRLIQRLIEEGDERG